MPAQFYNGFHFEMASICYLERITTLFLGLVKYLVGYRLGLTRNSFVVGTEQQWLAVFLSIQLLGSPERLEGYEQRYWLMLNRLQP
jgi:hypothetical protein